MRRFRPQFTVRRLMIAVAVVSVLLGTLARLQSRSEFYRLASEAEAKSVLDVARSVASPLSQEDYARIRLKMVWHVSKMKIYSEASKRPWLPVAPIPPEPE